MESQLLEIRRQSGLRQIIGDDFRSRGERRLDPGRNRQSLLDCFLRQKPCADEHGRIRSVRAGSNRSNHNAAVTERGLHIRRNVFVHVGIFHADRSRIASFRLPSSGVTGRRSRGQRRCLGRGLRLEQRGQGLEERFSRLRQHHAILRPLRPRQTGFHGREIEREQLRVLRLWSLLVMEEPLLARVGLNQRNLLLASAGEPQIAQRLLINRKNPASCPILRRHIRNRSPIRQRQITQSRPEVLNKLPDNAMLAQHLRNRQHEIGSSSALAQPPGQLHTNNQRNQHRDRLPQHGGFGFNASDAPS